MSYKTFEKILKTFNSMKLSVAAIIIFSILTYFVRNFKAALTYGIGCSLLLFFIRTSAYFADLYNSKKGDVN